MKIFELVNCSALFILINLVPVSCRAEINMSPKPLVELQKTYFIAADGNDNNDGSRKHPWKNISKVKGLVLQPGDAVLLQAGEIFSGTLVINYHTNGTVDKPIVISSYGNGMATINSGEQVGIIINNSSHLRLQNIKVKGMGRKEGNTTNGITISYCNNIRIDSMDIAGFQKAGLQIRNCSATIIQNVFAHDNGYAGIAVDGENFSKKECRDIGILNCRAENNPGDPTNFNNHSGNGIVVSQCTNVKIAYCTATNNGWDMPRIGNGPVGIWAWEADSVSIEHCLSYRNKTSNGGEDGGGFDFDGGITNSVIQYCLSYENEGSGIGLFQYAGATAWNNNTIRYNTSINDGNVSAAKAGIYIWNSSYENKLQHSFIYNNTVYNNKNAAIRFAKESANEGLVFYNNILIANNEIISGDSIAGKYLGNCWWSFSSGFDVQKINNFQTWARYYQQEILDGNIIGININPGFANISTINTSDAKTLASFDALKANNTLLLNGGIDLLQLFGMATGGKDFNGGMAPVKGIGSSF